MPFPIVWGVPSDFPLHKLDVLREEIVSYLARAMKIKPGYVTPFFPKDFLERPAHELENVQGGSTIFVSLATGMFQETLLLSSKDNQAIKDILQEANKAIKTVLHGLGELVADTFHRRYDVEVFVDSLNPDLKAFIPAEPAEPPTIIDVAIPRES